MSVVNMGDDIKDGKHKKVNRNVPFIILRSKQVPIQHWEA